METSYPLYKKQQSSSQPIAPTRKSSIKPSTPQYFPQQTLTTALENQTTNIFKKETSLSTRQIAGEAKDKITSFNYKDKKNLISNTNEIYEILTAIHPITEYKTFTRLMQTFIMNYGLNLVYLDQTNIMLPISFLDKCAIMLGKDEFKEITTQLINSYISYFINPFFTNKSTPEGSIIRSSILNFLITHQDKLEKPTIEEITSELDKVFTQKEAIINRPNKVALQQNSSKLKIDFAKLEEKITQINYNDPQNLENQIQALYDEIIIIVKLINQINPKSIDLDITCNLICLLINQYISNTSITVDLTKVLNFFQKMELPTKVSNKLILEFIEVCGNRAKSIPAETQAIHEIFIRILKQENPSLPKVVKIKACSEITKQLTSHEKFVQQDLVKNLTEYIINLNFKDLLPDYLDSPIELFDRLAEKYYTNEEFYKISQTLVEKYTALAKDQSLAITKLPAVIGGSLLTFVEKHSPHDIIRYNPYFITNTSDKKSPFSIERPAQCFTKETFSSAISKLFSISISIIKHNNQEYLFNPALAQRLLKKYPNLINSGPSEIQPAKNHIQKAQASKTTTQTTPQQIESLKNKIESFDFAATDIIVKIRELCNELKTLCTELHGTRYIGNMYKLIQLFIKRSTTSISLTNTLIPINLLETFTKYLDHNTLKKITQKLNKAYTNTKLDRKALQPIVLKLIVISASYKNHHLEQSIMLHPELAFYLLQTNKDVLDIRHVDIRKPINLEKK